jgi:hypothetical protein
VDALDGPRLDGSTPLVQVAGRPKQNPTRPLDRPQINHPEKGKHVHQEIDGKQWSPPSTKKL